MLAPTSSLLRLGAAHLTVTDLERSLAFYGDVVGLRVHRSAEGGVALGAGEDDLLVLHERPAARRPGRRAGLYHVALLFDGRPELARAAERLAAAQAPIQGASDHGTHEALYLADPDGNGLELAADRPRDAWPDISGPAGYGAGPDPLDVGGLLATVAGEPFAPRAASGLRVGHVHLHVADLEASERFYVDGLGLDVMTRLPGALFVAADGYHHHVGLNVWRGEGIPPAAPGAIGLDLWTLRLRDPDEVAAARARLSDQGATLEERGAGFLARDPAGIAVLVVAA